MRAMDMTQEIQRPPISAVWYTSLEGNPCCYRVGQGVTRIVETKEMAEYTFVPWVEIWDGDSLIARFNQHKLDAIVYERRP
jgi:hypothetical protein